MPEYVPDACSDLLFDAGSVDALVSAIERFTADPQRYAGTPITASTWDEHTGRVVAVYEEAIAGHG
jgi:hypothetical protein